MSGFGDAVRAHEASTSQEISDEAGTRADDETLTDIKSEDVPEATTLKSSLDAVADTDQGDSSNGIAENNRGTKEHARSSSNIVEVIEAPQRSRQESQVVPQTTNDASSSTSRPASIRPGNTQLRHTDKPEAYQSTTPRIYLSLRAMALQLPNNIASTSSATHIEPPTLILEGRTNLSSARRSYYSKVTRTLPELHLWLLALTLSFPASIFSPFTYPPASLMNSTTATDAAIRNYMTTITNQFGRILSKSYVLSHPATVALIDCDFSYLPSLPHIGPGSSPMARKKMEEGIKIARAGFDPLKGKRGGMTSTWDAEGVAAALGLPPSALPNYTEASSSNMAAASRNPLSIFTRANASPQRIQVAPPVALPPGEEDDDEEDLTLARNEITRLEMQFEKASLAAQMVVDKSGALSATLNQLIQALNYLEQLDSGRLIAKRSKEDEIIKIMTRGIEGWAASENGVNSTIISTIVPAMSYQSYNARMAIDALLRRAAAATHRHSALIVLVQKRREAERLKRARGEIRQDEVDWVLSELKEAQRTTNLLTHHLATFTATLKDELKQHSKSTHTDVQNALLNHARSSIRAHKFMLNSLTKARDDLIARKEGKMVQSTSFSASTLGEADAAVKVVAEQIATQSAELEGPTTVVEPVKGIEEEEINSPAAVSEKSLPDAPSNDAFAPHKVPSVPSTSTDSAGVIREQSASQAVPTKEDVEVQSVNSIREDVEQRRSMSQSSMFSPAAPSDLPGRLEATPTMSQSAFLPARNINRYANPFARLDQGTPSAPNLGQTTNAVNGAQPSISQEPPAKPKVNDVWANRSRLSASDAARSLAGRF